MTNLLRLNNLNDDVKLLVEHGDIEMGHARALLALEGDTQSETAQVVSGKGLTVRGITEKLIKAFWSQLNLSLRRKLIPMCKTL